ncbi:flagellar export protein FliJ [Halalkalibacillus halophilus]|uniref:flagellar export protein FliJ n=1 Tax=Halalkalibacillus halophilus TaxID=392827 RepID=UPI00042839B4|nr:flagellar export protein FliJ [Halalkalibacillus halophilus]
MNGYETLNKLLQIKKNEMEEYQVAYNRAQDFFESVATDLYDLLKEKEELFASQQDKMKKGLQVEMLRQFHNYEATLISKEEKVQLKVHQARTNMQKKQEQLKAAHTEVKKYEKLIEHRKKEMKDAELHKETNFLDEISVQQYARSNQG